LEQNQVLVIFVKKWTNFTKQSQRNYKGPKFFHKIQNAENTLFSHRFSILDQKSLPRDFQMGMAYRWQLQGLWDPEDGSGNWMDGF